ncbi:MAG: hypothetical protein LBU28_08475 [Spirochaetaceae bacterium]|jgi:hypothetical protein|nr:hypothetical protein [Spirochaetaceae bacterium]
MKKLFMISVLAVVLGGLAPVLAQENNKSDFYYVNVPIDKVYPYRRGYVITYRKGVTQQVRAYLPLEWFSDTGGKGELIYQGTGADWPHLTVYYKAGEFSHVRLYLRRDRGHETWGNVPLGVDIDDKFDNVTDLKLEF